MKQLSVRCRLTSTLTLVLACLVAACATGAVPQTDLTAPSTPGGPAPGGEVETAQPPPTAPAFDLPWPGDLTQVLPRAASAGSQLVLLGDDFFQKSDNATPDGVSHELRLNAGAGEMSWGIFGFAGVLADDGPFGIEVGLAGAAPGEYYVGVADYNRETWRWTEIGAPTGSDFLSVPAQWLPVSGGGVAYAAVVAWDGELASVMTVTLHLNLDAPPPVGLSASDGVSGSTINLSWEDPQDSYPGLSFDAVQLERAPSAGGPFGLLATIPPGTTVYEDEHDGVSNFLPYNAPVYYRASTVVSGTPGPAGAADSGYRLLTDVPGFIATTDLPDRIELDWYAVAGAEDYVIEYRANGGGDPADWTLLDAVADLAYTHAESSPPGCFCVEKQLYEYQIQARYLGDLSLDYGEAFGLRDGPPVGVVTATPQAAYPGFPVTIDGTGSYDSGGGSIDFFRLDGNGDGAYEDGGPVGQWPYVYGMFGEYQATIEVTDDEGDIATGSVPVSIPGWAHTWGGTDREEFRCVAGDAQGYVNAAGRIDFESKSYLLFAKYHQGGGLSSVHYRDVDATGMVNINGVAADAAGNAYLVGLTSKPGPDREALIVRWLANGEPDWARTLSTSDDEMFLAVALDGAGFIYAIGKVQDSSQRILLAKYNAAGERLWAKAWASGTDMYDVATGLAIPSGPGDPPVYVCGSTNAVETARSALLLKFDTAGNLEEQAVWSIPPQTPVLTTIAVDSNTGKVYLGGWLSEATPTNTLLLRWTPGDGFDWQKSWTGQGSHEDNSHGLVLLPSGVWLIGNTMSFSDGAQIDVLLLGYAFDGTLLHQGVWNPDTGAEMTHTGGLAEDGGIIIAGGAPDPTGVWHVYTGTQNNLSGTAGTVNGTVADYTADHLEAQLSTVSFTGVEDTGGGLLDALVMKLGPLP